MHFLLQQLQELCQVMQSVGQVHSNLLRLSPGWCNLFGLTELWKVKGSQNSLLIAK
jgi:hypothetical protein